MHKKSYESISLVCFVSFFFFNERLSPRAEFIYPFKNWWKYYFQPVIMPPHLRDKDITSCPLGSQRRLQFLPSACLATQSETIIYETVSCRDEDKLCRESDKLSNANHGKVSLLYRHWRKKIPGVNSSFFPTLQHVTCNEWWWTLSLGTVSSDRALVQHDSSWILRDPSHRI